MPGEKRDCAGESEKKERHDRSNESGIEMVRMEKARPISEVVRVLGIKGQNSFHNVKVVVEIVQRSFLWKMCTLEKYQRCSFGESEEGELQSRTSAIYRIDRLKVTIAREWGLTIY